MRLAHWGQVSGAWGAGGLGHTPVPLHPDLHPSCRQRASQTQGMQMHVAVERPGPTSWARLTQLCTGGPGELCGLPRSLPFPRLQLLTCCDGENLHLRLKPVSASGTGGFSSFPSFPRF